MKKILIVLLSAIAVSAAAQPKIVAHRGFYKTPGSEENTISSLANAQRLGVFKFFEQRVGPGDRLIGILPASSHLAGLTVDRTTSDDVQCSARLMVIAPFRVVDRPEIGSIESHDGHLYLALVAVPRIAGTSIQWIKVQLGTSARHEYHTAGDQYMKSLFHLDKYLKINRDSTDDRRSDRIGRRAHFRIPSPRETTETKDVVGAYIEAQFTNTDFFCDMRRQSITQRYVFQPEISSVEQPKVG